MTTTTRGLDRKGLTDHTVGSFDPEYGYWQVVGFSALLPEELARNINSWRIDHPEFRIAKVHYSSAGDAVCVWYSALIEIDRVIP